MFKNRFSQLLSSFNKIKEKIPFLKTKENTQKQVSNILDINIPSANDTTFTPETQSKIDSVSNKTDDIVNIPQEPINILGDFSGYKKFKFRKQGYKLQFQDGVIINAYKVKNGKNIPVKATTIRQISALLKKSSHDVSKITYSTKRNSQNTFNTKLHGQYTYTNESKTQFIIIVNKGEIIKSIYKKSKTAPSQDEIQVIQSSINKGPLGLSGHKSARVLKKQMKKNNNPQSNISEEETLKLNGTKKHNEAIKAKEKREKIAEDKLQHEKKRIEKESQIQQDFQTLFRYQMVLSKCNNQGSIVNGSEKIAKQVFKVLGMRKGISGNNLDNFLSSKNKFEVFKKIINEYLEIGSHYSIQGQSNRNSLYNIFINASEIYSTYLYKEKKTPYNKQKTNQNIFEHESLNDSKHKSYSSQQAKADWVKRYYPNEEAA